jgi:DNA polymerase-3 subunit delta'
MPTPIIALYGHERLRERLSDALERGTLPASMLLHGPRGVGKQRLALWLGQAALCSGPAPRPCGRCPQCRYSLELAHPDLQWIFPRPRLKDGDPSLEDVRDDYAEAIAERVAAHGLYAPPSGSEGIYVATIRAVVRSASMSPAMAQRKVFVIGDAERMVPQEGAEAAANAFLKLLEEPPNDTLLILTSSEAGALLPTIRSRVVAIRVASVTDEAVRAFLSDPIVTAFVGSRPEEQNAETLVTAAAGAPGRLVAGELQRDVTSQAQRLLEAATARDRAARYRVAFTQGGSRARGSFADTLDALTSLLHDRVRAATAAGDERLALGAAKAVEVVEAAKERVAGNVNPQLLTISLVREIAELLK